MSHLLCRHCSYQQLALEWRSHPPQSWKRSSWPLSSSPLPVSHFHRPADSVSVPSALKESKTEIRIQFKLSSSALLPSTIPNTLTIRVQPDEGVYLQINSNLPSLRPGPRTVPMELDLTYRGRVSEGQIPNAYENLILDAVRGDYTHSVRGDELDASWRVFTPLLHFLDQGGGELKEYAFGEWFGRVGALTGKRAYLGLIPTPRFGRSSSNGRIAQKISSVTATAFYIMTQVVAIIFILIANNRTMSHCGTSPFFFPLVAQGTQPRRSCWQDSPANFHSYSCRIITLRFLVFRFLRVKNIEPS